MDVCAHVVGGLRESVAFKYQKEPVIRLAVNFNLYLWLHRGQPWECSMQLFKYEYVRVNQLLQEDRTYMREPWETKITYTVCLQAEAQNNSNSFMFNALIHLKMQHLIYYIRKYFN